MLLLSFRIQALISQVQSQGSTENLLADVERSLIIRGAELYWTQVYKNDLHLRAEAKDSLGFDGNPNPHLLHLSARNPKLSQRTWPLDCTQSCHDSVTIRRERPVCSLIRQAPFLCTLYNQS